MAKNAVTDWSTSAAFNTDVGGIGIQGSSNISSGDNALREIMAQIATFNTAASFGATTVWTSTDAGATAGPVLTLYRNSATPAASDILGKLLFQGKDSAANVEDYAEVYAVLDDPTSTSEDASLLIRNKVAGTMTTQATVSATGWNGMSIVQPTLTLKQSSSPTPTAEGAIEWDTDDDALVVGTGSAAKVFRPNQWEHIRSYTPSGAAAIAETDLSAFRMLRLTGFLLPATDGTALQLRSSTNNGSSYDAGASDYDYQIGSAIVSTAAAAGGTTSAFSLSVANAGNVAASEGCWFDVVLLEFNQAAYARLVGTVSSVSTAGQVAAYFVSQRRAQGTARNALQITAASGNISGFLTLSGVRG